MEPRAIVEQIQREILNSRQAAISTDFVNALNLISEVVFSRSSGFILEFLQNAEDSGLDLASSGCFNIAINKKRIKLVHNGSPFIEKDVRAVCGIRSSKKPERGTLGYLGIGFKSVFKVSDAPEIHSGEFHFKFDKGHWSPSDNVPWQVVPVWIEGSLPRVPDDATKFIVPFKDADYYHTLRSELEHLGTELYLFLKWLRKIEITDEVTNEKWTLQNFGERDDVTTLGRDSTQQRFRFFRKVVTVPDAVRRDPLTQHYRRNVVEREIAIAFALDDNNNLAPSEAGAMYGGVYSFLPLGEARSGAKFPIQADFLVQPGRDAINYEAKWNHWLVEEVAGLCKTAIHYFKKHPSWKYQFLRAFDFTKSAGLESYDKLFGPKLIEPITRLLEASCIPTSDDKWVAAADVVRVKPEERDAIAALVSSGLLTDESEIASVLGNRSGLHLVHPDADAGGVHVKDVDRWDLLKNADYLNKQAKRGDAAKWFRSLYLWLRDYPALEKYFYRTWRSKAKTYHQYEIVLTGDSALLKGGAVSFFDVPASDAVSKAVAVEFGKSKKLLHRDILDGARDDVQRDELRAFLTGYAGVQVLDSEVVCREAILPKILVSATKPKRDELLRHTQYCFEKLGAALPSGIEFWVIGKQGGVRPAKEMFFATEFNPEQNWEANSQFVPGLHFLSPDYLPAQIDSAQQKLWREFFVRGGVRSSAPGSMVEQFAMNYAQQALTIRCKKITPVNKANYGYDLEAVLTTTGKTHHAGIRIEVKGQTSDSDVELTPEETIAADKHKGNYYVSVVSSIPESPVMHMVQNPAAPGVGKKDKLTIPVKVWKRARWP